MTETNSSSFNEEHLSEEHASLWPLFASPVIWATHFLASYIVLAVWCAKSNGSADAMQLARWLVGLFTAVALAGIFWIGWVGYQRHRVGGGVPPHDDDTPLDRHRFLGFSTLLLSVMSGIATVFVAIVVVMINNCDG